MAEMKKKESTITELMHNLPSSSLMNSDSLSISVSSCATNKITSLLQDATWLTNLMFKIVQFDHQLSATFIQWNS